ncbi:RRM_6 domain-containing protein [Cephalotus follicularis]|uniref:RRM_6 domain-containing protein n=1 Tax=Cephalotus follicularis TaxID=3775 RepID=A0A1Q3AW81_CEPFO|nr:RRM_6 domain-containing protein [Cephalotus follicularis]
MMMSIGRSLPQPVLLSNSNSTNINLQNHIIPYISILSPNNTPSQKPHKTHLSLNPFSTSHLFTFDKTRSGFCVSALNKPRKLGGPSGLIKMDGFDDDDEEGGFDGFIDGEDEDDEYQGIFLPFGNMKKWLENKPRGFGEGKVYDTCIEDKLLEEMEQSRHAQAVNVEQLNNSPVKPVSKKDHPNNIAVNDIPSGIRVRLTNLPKKKNIHRDLKYAFEDIRGIVNIVPAVSGNKKTNDPICKGFAFVDFKSEEDATRFIQKFSGQSIAFGKLQKQIKCKMMNPHSSNSINEQATANTYIVPESTVPEMEENATDYEWDEFSLDFPVETASDASDDPDDDMDKAKLENIRINLEYVSDSVKDVVETMVPMTKVKSDYISSNELEEIRAIEKRLLAKGKVEKIRKLEVPGSAKRLKIKEKALLTSVFSKYGVKAPSTSKEDS